MRSSKGRKTVWPEGVGGGVGWIVLAELQPQPPGQPEVFLLGRRKR